MPQSNAPSLLDYVPLPKPKRKPRPYDPSMDPRPQFDLSFPMEPSRVSGGSSMGSVDRADAGDREHGLPAAVGQAPARSTKKTQSPVRNRNAGGGGSPIRARELEPLMRSSIEGDIYKDLSFPSNRYQQDNYSTSTIIEAGSTQRFGQYINFTIRRIYNGCFSIDIGVRDTNQQWQVLIQKVEATDHIMRLWETSPSMCQSDIGVLGTWLLACTKLDFDSTWVIGARFEYASLRDLCAREIYAAVSRAAITIQAYVRRYIVMKRLGRRDYDQRSYESRFPVRSNHSDTSLHSSRSSLSSEFSRSLTSSVRLSSQRHSPVPPAYRLSNTDPYSSPRGAYPESDIDRSSGVRFMQDASDPYGYRDNSSVFSESDKMVPRKPGAPKANNAVRRGRTVKPRTPSRSASPRGRQSESERQPSAGRDGALSRGGSRSRSPRGRAPLASEKYAEEKEQARLKKMSPVKKPVVKKKVLSSAHHVPVKPDMDILSLELRQMRERMELLQDTLRLQNEYREKLDAKANEEIQQARKQADEAIKKAKADALLEILNLFRGGADIDHIVRQLGVDRSGASSAQEARRAKPPVSREGMRASSASHADRSLLSANHSIREEPDRAEEDVADDDESQNVHLAANSIARGLPKGQPMPPKEAKRQKTKSFRVTKELPNALKTGGASSVNNPSSQATAQSSLTSIPNGLTGLSGDSSIMIVPGVAEPDELNYSAQQLQQMQASDKVVEKLKLMGNTDDEMSASEVFAALRVAVDMNHTGLFGLSMERLCRILSYSPRTSDIECLEENAEFFMSACGDFVLEDTSFSSIVGCISVIVERLDVAKMNGKAGARPPSAPKNNAIKALCNFGLINFLIAALEMHYASEKFTYQILSAMTALAKVKEEYEREMSSRVVAGAVMTVLQEHRARQRPVEAVARWVIQCCRDSTFAQENLCQAGVTASIPAVMRTLLTSDPSAKYNEVTATTIGLLCKAGLALCGDKNRENMIALCSPENCKIFVEVLGILDGNNSSTCENVLWLLLNTVSASAETRGNIYKCKLPYTITTLLDNKNHGAAVTQYGVYLVSSLASDKMMKTELGHQGLITVLMKIAESNNLADMRRTARMCIQKVSDDPNILRSVSRQRQGSRGGSRSGSRGGSAGAESPVESRGNTATGRIHFAAAGEAPKSAPGKVPVVEAPISEGQVEQQYWNSSRKPSGSQPSAAGGDEEGTSVSIDVPLTNALNEGGGLGSPSQGAASPQKSRDRDDSADRWSSEARRAKVKAKPPSDETSAPDGSQRDDGRGNRGDGSRGRSPTKRPVSKGDTGKDGRSSRNSEPGEGELSSRNDARQHGGGGRSKSRGSSQRPDGAERARSRGASRRPDSRDDRAPSRGAAERPRSNTGRAPSRGASERPGSVERAHSRGSSQRPDGAERARSRGASRRPDSRDDRAPSRGASERSVSKDIRDPGQGKTERTKSSRGSFGDDASVDNDGQDDDSSVTARKSNASSRRRSKSKNDDGSVKKKKKKKKQKSVKNIAVEDDPPTSTVPDYQPEQPTEEATPSTLPPKESQLNMVFGKINGVQLDDSYRKPAKKTPKTAEGKPSTPRKDEIREVAAEPVTEANVIPSEEQADTKAKPDPERTQTRREAMLIEAKMWQEKSAVLKKQLTVWNREFLEKYKRKPTTEDKKRDESMQELFHNYFEASNKYKIIIAELEA